MCEILVSNFEVEFPAISAAINSASFIAIDAEFTGLEFGLHDKISLFDTPQQRYSKLCRNASTFIISQIGISAYVKDSHHNRYNVHTYNFYLCPRSMSIKDSVFMCQASSFEFLCQHKFDFNKFAYEGLPFLRQDQEAELWESLRNKTLFGSIRRDAMDEYSIQSSCSEVAEWLATDPKQGEQLVLTVDASVCDYILHKEIRLSFPELWTLWATEKKVVVQKVSPEERLEFEKKSDDLDTRLVNSLLGFTRVFKVLVASKKPIVGHNLLFDLVHIYEHFYKPLPKNYDVFKYEILGLFPRIFDTKHIAYVLRQQLSDSGILHSTTLGELYTALHSHKGRFHVLFSPEINHQEGFDRYASSQPYHEAGFDAFLAGAVFLRLAHIHALKDELAENHHPLAFKQLLLKVESFRNCVNLIRADRNFINLQGTDPKSSRPQWLVIESRSSKPLDLAEIVDLCSQHGSVDVKLIARHQALVATMNFLTDRGIIKTCKKDKDISVSRYSILRHSKLCRSCLWASAVLTSTIGISLLLKVGRNLKWI